MLCIESNLTFGVATATMAVVINSASMTVDRDIDAHLQADTTNATMTVDGGIDATLGAGLSSSEFSYLCPVEYVTSSFSLGGWDDDLGWDDDKGWKD